MQKQHTHKKSNDNTKNLKKIWNIKNKIKKILKE